MPHKTELSGLTPTRSWLNEALAASRRPHTFAIPVSCPSWDNYSRRRPNSGPHADRFDLQNFMNIGCAKSSSVRR